MTRPVLLFLLSGLLVTALTAPVFSGSLQEPAAEDHEHTVIEDQMKKIKGGMRSLRRGLRDAETLPAALPVILEMQAAAQIAKAEVPVMAKSIADEKERAAFVVAFRVGVIAMQKTMLELEEAVLAGDLEKCTLLYKALGEGKDKGHDRFTEE
jgi:hypothetical protein